MNYFRTPTDKEKKERERYQVLKKKFSDPKEPTHYISKNTRNTYRLPLPEFVEYSNLKKKFWGGTSIKKSRKRNTRKRVNKLLL